MPEGLPNPDQQQSTGNSSLPNPAQRQFTGNSSLPNPDQRQSTGIPVYQTPPNVIYR